MEQANGIFDQLPWWLLGVVVVLLLLAPVLRARGAARRRAARPPGTGTTALSSADAPAPVAPAPDPVPEPPTPADESGEAGGDIFIEDIEEAELSHASRLELARVYLDLGDASGAGLLLERVLADGSEAERVEAGRLRARISEDGDEDVVEESVPADVEGLLDLAVAYVEIGDEPSARRMAARIEAAGSPSQRRQVRELMARFQD